MPKSTDERAPAERKQSRACAQLPTTLLGKHGSRHAITIKASKGAESFGEFSISKAGVAHGGKFRSWRSLAKFIDKSKKLG